MQKGGSLMDLYKVLKNILNLSEAKYSNDSIKSILRSLTAIVEGLDNLSNEMGDRHIRPVAPQRHHAQLCVNAAKTITNFLYDTLEHHFKGKENIYEQLIGVLDSDTRLLPSDQIMAHRDVQRVFRRTDPYIRNLLKKKLIEEFKVDSYRDSDIFFAALQVLRDELKPADVKAIYDAQKLNSQACGLKSFLKEIGVQKPNLLTPDMLTYCAS